MISDDRKAPLARISQIAPSLEVLPENIDSKVMQIIEEDPPEVNVNFPDDSKPDIPDGGWGWFVVLSSFIINMISEGVVFTFGLLYIEFSNEFNASASATSWIGSLFMAVPLLAGPICSALVDKYGCKSMTILGGLICTVGFILSAYTKTLGVMYVTFGVIGGLGRGLCYVTAVVSIAFWFEKKRTFVLGLAASGAGFGTVVLAPIATFLLSEYGWRGTLLITSGYFANFCVCGVLMRNPDWIIKQEKAAKHEKIEQSKDTANQKYQDDLQMLKERLKNVEDGQILFQQDVGTSKALADIGKITSAINLPTFLKGKEKVPAEVIKQLSENEQMYKIILENYPHLLREESASDKNLKVPSSEVIETARNLVKLRLKGDSDGHMNNGDTNLLARKELKSNSKNSKNSLMQSHSYLRNIRFRKDSIGFKYAMLNTHRYKIKASSCPNVYRNSMTSLACQEEEKWYEEYLDLLHHFSLFLDLHFLLLALSTIILFVWFIVPYFYLAEHMTQNGYTEEDASFVLSIIGFTNTIGMIGLGWAGDRLNVAKTYSICLLVTGVATGGMMFFSHNYILLCVSSGFFGLFFASCFSLTPSLLAELVPLEDFTMAYGLILLCDGIGNLIGPPLAGVLYDMTNSWNQSFYQSAIWTIISGILIGIIPFTKNKRILGRRK